MATDPTKIAEILTHLTLDETQRPPENTRKTLPFNFVVAIAKRCGFPERHVVMQANPRHPHPQFDAALLQLKEAPRGSILILVGPRGTGKTQLAVDAIIDRFSDPYIDDAQRPRYAKLADVFREIRACYREDSIDSEIAIFQKYSKASVLVIDEAQERAETDFENRTLTQIIDKRYDAMLDTIVISNFTKDEMGKSMGPSIVSRIHECGQVIECNWPSFREH
jgi:DNA replication protein DnaC